MTNQQLADVRQAVSAVRKERILRAGKLPARKTIETAIADAERDIDSLTNERATTLRAEIDRLADRLTNAWVTADWYRASLARMRNVGIVDADLPHSARFRALLKQEEDLRAATSEKLADGHAGLAVPPVFTGPIPPLPDADTIRRDIAAARARETRKVAPWAALHFRQDGGDNAR